MPHTARSLALPHTMPLSTTTPLFLPSVRQWKVFSGPHLLRHYFFTEKEPFCRFTVQFRHDEIQALACMSPDAQNRTRKLHPITFTLNWLCKPQIAGESSSSQSSLIFMVYFLRGNQLACEAT